MSESQLEEKEQFYEHEQIDVDHLKDKKGVPDFWSTILSKSPEIKQHTNTDQDIEVLEYATQIKAEHSDKPSTISIQMHFRENPFFENGCLQLQLRFDEETDHIEGVVGSDINWKKGKNLCTKRVRKIQKNLKTDHMRVIYDYKKLDSFFNIFESPEIPPCDKPSCQHHKEV